MVRRVRIFLRRLIQAYRKVKADDEWHAWVKENVPKGVWPRGPFR